MLQVRASEQRGKVDMGWLQSQHSFSFGDYYDQQHMGFGPLRVINDDWIAGGEGFGTHGHKDMEIITYVLSGNLEHKDSMGNGSVLRYGDVQRMSAGTGVQHSEFNHGRDEVLHLLQIWIMPKFRGIRPGYEEKHFDADSKRGRLRLIVSSDGRDGSVAMNQDGAIYASILRAGDTLSHELAPGRIAYVHVALGKLVVNGVSLNTGDALKVTDENLLTLAQADAERGAEVLLFDLPA